ncbi:MAG: rod shape-determining protein MreD [Nitrospirota bacterium]|jgi:rod shape-determining protein MreD
MKREFGILAIALLTALCFVLESRLQVLGIRPNLTVLPVYYVGLRHGPLKGAAFGALIGAIADSLSGHLLGPNLLSKGTAGILASVVTGGFLRWSPLLGALSLFAITWADGTLSLASLSFFAKAHAGTADAARAMLGQAAVNGVIGVFLRPGDE